MSHQSTHHHHSLLNSIPQTHHHQPNLIPPIKPENDSDGDDVVFLPNEPKVLHEFTPENYDPSCECSTCQLVRKLLAECTCEECRGTGQRDQSSENVPIANAVSPTNGQSSSSLIQNNDASTSEHTNEDDQHDDHSRSSTPDYLPRFFDDESGDSSSDSNYDDSFSNINNGNGSNSGNNSNVPDHTFSNLISRKCLKRSYNESQFNKHTKTNDSKRKHKCPHCGRNLPSEHFNNHIRTHSYSGFRCVWLNCGFFYAKYQTAKKHVCIDHLQVDTADTQQTNRYLVKVDPRTGQTTKIMTKIRRETGPSQHLNANDQNDDRSSSSTPDYLPRFFDDESEDSSSNDSENDDDSVNDGAVEDYREFESESDDDDNSRNADYAFSKLSTSKSLKRSHSKRSNKQTETIHVDKRHKCRLCNQYFSTIKSLTRHDRVIHQKLKPYYCKWPKSIFLTGRQDGLIEHITMQHFNHRKNVNKANLYVGKRKLETKGIDRTLSLHGSNDNEKDNSDCDKSSKESNTDQQGSSFDCPKCESSFDELSKLLRHYRGVHQDWKPYYCKFPKCEFVGSVFDKVVHHVNRKHFDMKNRKEAKNYVGTRKMPSSPPQDPIYESILRDKSFNSNCPKCDRNFADGGSFWRHLATHKKSGFRCRWNQCSFFFSDKRLARKHIRREHFIGKLMDSTQIDEHLVVVDPKTNISQNRTARCSTDDDHDSNYDDGETGEGEK